MITQRMTVVQDKSYGDLITEIMVYDHNYVLHILCIQYHKENSFEILNHNGTEIKILKSRIKSVNTTNIHFVFMFNENFHSTC